mmetsp:Transcript_6524/g.18793  ORF Transcript_6524/g.18793 Transcript_6524/m.18793 type:complete len:121 (-) Transcript_6524:661-1023(-)
MPLVEVTTNVVGSNIDMAAALKGFTDAASESIRKPVQYFAVIIKPDAALLFAGTDAPAAYANVASIGHLTDHEADITAKLAAEAEKHLGVPSDRFYVQFTEKEAHEWGWKGTSFDKMTLP